MENTLYIITDPAGVGKSTASKMLAETKVKSALIEGDDIYHQVIGGYIQAWKEGNHLQLFWNICINTIKEYLKNGYDVVFNYIVNEENLEKIKQELKGYNIKFVVLMVEENTLILRDKQRPEDCQMGKRCIELLNSFKKKNINEKYMLKTDNLAPEEVVNILENENRFYY